MPAPKARPRATRAAAPITPARRRFSTPPARAAFAAVLEEEVVLLSASSAKARSFADWKRCSGCFSRQRRTMRSSPGETGVVISLSSGGSSFRIAVIVSAAVSWRKARLPEIIS